MILRSLTGSILIVALSAHAQEQLGIAHSNYAGTDALSLNPARLATQWCWRDVNITGADEFVWNDHVYVTARDRTLYGEMRQSIRTGNGDGFTFTESPDGGSRHAFGISRLKGPAIAMSMGRSGLAAEVSTRFYTSATGLGSDLARFMFNGLNFPSQHGIRYSDAGLKISSAAWSEFGITFSRILKAKGFDLLSVGATAKYLLAHEGAGIQFDALDYTVIDSARAEVHDASGSYGIAQPAFVAGTGFGLDLGITYERTLDEADGYIPHQSHGGCDPLAYRYRLGLSVLDMGGMRFASAMSGTFNSSSASYPDYPAIAVGGETGVDSLLRHSFDHFTPASGFGVGLPTAVALQYDQRIIDHLYVAADAVQNIAPLSSLRLRRTNTLAMVPRFETKRFEAAVPVVLHEYDIRRPSIGLMLRVNSVIIGSDNLLAAITRAPVYGADVYFRLKWTVFRGPYCRGKKTSRHREGDGNPLPCKVPGD